MTVTKEYWNIPKPDDVLSVAQGTNLTVFVDHADNALVCGLTTSDIISLVLSAIGIVIGLLAYRAASKASDAAEMANNLAQAEGEANREHNYQSVRPLLDVEHSREIIKNGFIKRTSVTNHGAGAAILKTVELYGQGRSYFLSSNDKTLLTAFLLLQISNSIKDKEFDPIDFIPLATSISSNTFFGSNKSMVLLQVQCTNVPDDIRESITDALNNIQVRAVYHCVYDQKYILDTVIIKN
jgi:hypothetical protein